MGMKGGATAVRSRSDICPQRRLIELDGIYLDTRQAEQLDGAGNPSPPRQSVSRKNKQTNGPWLSNRISTHSQEKLDDPLASLSNIRASCLGGGGTMAGV